MTAHLDSYLDNIGVFQTLSLGEGDHRLWFAGDELDALGPIDGLGDALPRLRKFGGRCAICFQSISQLSTTYGQERAARDRVRRHACRDRTAFRSIGLL